MANTIFNNIFPVSVPFNIDHQGAYTPPPTNKPNPGYILPPGSGGYGAPKAAVPASAGNLKKAIAKLPSIFNLTS